MPGTNEYLSGNFGETFSARNTPTQVNVAGFSGNALDGIINAISKQSRSIDNLLDSFNESEDNNRRNSQSQLVRSVNSERRQRAANAALNGKIDKSVGVLDVALKSIKSAISELASIVATNFKNSIASFQDLSRAMRERNLTRDQKDRMQTSVTSVQDELKSRYGIQLMGEDLNQIFKSLLDSGKNLDALHDEQRTVFAALVHRGASAEQAYNVAISTNKENIGAITSSIKTLSDYNVSSRVFKNFDNLTSAQVQVMGGWHNALNDITTQQREMAKYSVWLNQDASAELGTIANLLSSGQLEAIREEDKAVIAKFGNVNSPAELAEAMINASNKDLTEFARIMSDQQKLSGPMLDALNQLKSVRMANPDQLRVKVRSDDENAEADEQYTSKGTLAYFIDKNVRDLFGGLLGPAANWIDEKFGDSVKIEDITSKGFTTVCALLAAIAAGGGFKTALPALGTSIAGALTTAVPMIGKAILTMLSKLPVIGAAIAAAMSVGAAVDTYIDSKQRYDNIEKASADLKTARGNLADYEAKLSVAKQEGDTQSIRKYSALIEETNAKLPELMNAVQIAEDNRTIAHKTYVDYDREMQAKTRDLANQRNEYTALMQKAKLSGDMESYNVFKKQHDDIEARRLELWDNIVKVREESEGPLVQGLSQLYDLFGGTFTPEDMIAWSNFKSDVKGFFTEDIPDFFIETIPSAFGTAVDWTWNNILQFSETAYNKIEPLLSSVKGFFTEDIPDAFSSVKSFFDENFVEPISAFFDEIGGFVDKNFISPLRKFFKFDWLPGPVKRFLFDGSYGASDLAGDLTKSAFYSGRSMLNEASNFIKRLLPFANGGIVDRATPAIVGEAGKEAVIPLTNQSAMTNVIKSLTADEKFSLIRSLLSAGGNLTKLDFIKILYSTIFGNSQSSSQATSVGNLVQNDLTRAIIEGAAAQKGHSYTEMMCNQLVEAALKYAGFTPPTTGIVTRHFNNPKMRLVLNDPVNGISPNDPALLPGMILFSHPFTQAEADQLNRTKGGNRKAGDPGHMGIYAGDGLWWNSTSAKSFVDYSSGSGIKSTAAGVALTKPYRRGTYKLYAAGYYEGMFSNDAVSGLPRASAGEGFGSTSGLLSQEDIMSLENAAGSNSSIMKRYIDQANKLVSSDNKGDIIAILMEIAKYLKGIASAPSNKSSTIPVGRPLTPVYR